MHGQKSLEENLLKWKTVAWGSDILNGYYCLPIFHSAPTLPTAFHNEDVLTVKIRKTLFKIFQI